MIDTARSLGTNQTDNAPLVDRWQTYVAGSEPGPVAAFTADVTSGEAPLEVVFTDASTGTPTSWAWNFGDGATATEQNPVHTYTAIGRFNVTLTVTNDAGSDTLIRHRYITVREAPQRPPETEENFTFHDNGTSVADVGGRQQVSFNTTTGNGTVNGNDIVLERGNMNVTIRTDGLTTNGSVSTGNVTGVLLESTPVTTNLGGDLGNVSVGFNASMNGYNPNLGITTAIYDQPSDGAATSFTLAAANDGLSITSTAYAVYFVKTNLGANDTISNAVLQMTVSPAWVNANGGTSAIRVYRQDDDGNVEALATTYVGLDGNGMMVFEAVSPNGFSAFAVVATAAAPSSSSASSSSGGGNGTATSVGAASNLAPGENVTLAMDATAISAVTLTANTGVKDLMVTVARGTLPQAAEPPAGTVYQYVQATLYKAAETDLAAVQFRFAVPASWLTAQGCTADQVTLFRYADGAWQAVPAETLGEENGNAVFSAAADGFGLFAIATTGEIPTGGEATLQPTAAATTPATTAAAQAAGSTPTPQASPLPVWAAILAFGFLLFVRRT